MNERLKDIIQYKTGGKQTAFATLLGWSPQYLAKLLNGGNFGLQPALTILKTFPDINARWFLIGDGEMIDGWKQDSLRSRVFENIQSMLDIDSLVPVMSAEELHQLEQAVVKLQMPVFSPDTLAKLQCLINERNNRIEAIFASAKLKSDELCKPKTVRK